MNNNHAIIHRHAHTLRPIPTGLSPRLRPLEGIRVVLFDVYGTILVSGCGDLSITSSQPGKDEAALGDLLQRYGIAYSPQQLAGLLTQAVTAAHRAAHRRGVRHAEVDILRIWQSILGTSDHPLLEAFALEYELIVNPVWPMPGLKPLLESCRNQGKAMGVISNAQFYTPLLLEWFLEGALPTLGFDERLMAFSYRLGEAKPSPVMFQRIAGELTRLGLSTNAALMVGNDTVKDIRPAHQAGFKTALFAGDSRSLRPLPAENRGPPVKPDVVLTDLRQLIEVLAG